MFLAWLEKPVVRYPLYVGTAFLVFAIAMGFTFPDDEIKDILVVEGEKALKHKYKLSIGELDLWRFSGVALQSVSLEEREVNPEPVDPDAPAPIPTKIRFERVRARIAPVASVLNLSPTIVFELETGGGALEGSFEAGSKAHALNLDATNLDLRKANLLAALTGMPFFGEMDLDARFEFDAKFQPVDGHFKLQGRQLSVGPATITTDKFPPMSYFEIPQTSFGTMIINMEMTPPEDGKGAAKLEVKRFEASGRDIRLETWGDITMAPQFGKARPKLEMRLQLDDSFVKDNSLAPLLNVAEFRKGKGKEWYGFVLNGTFDRIQFKGSAAASNGRSAAATP